MSISGDTAIVRAPLENAGAGAAYVFGPNTPPVAEYNGPYLVAIGNPVSLDGSGSSDPDGDPLSESWAETGGPLGAIADSTFTAGNDTGITEVTLTVDDGKGGTVTDKAMLVVFDPEGGFVTGGGWIDSPINLDYQYMQVDGKATFGFVCKYNKKTKLLGGNTEFQFNAGDLNFHSSSYDWLLITGSDYAKFKGSGTINGGGNYRFKIWAGDDNPDTFHIKIWDNVSEVVVYDNENDQPIGGGSIVIHKK